MRSKFLALQALMLLDRQERHADGVGTGSGQKWKSQAGALAGEKFVRNLNRTPAPSPFRGRIRGSTVRLRRIRT